MAAQVQARHLVLVAAAGLAAIAATSVGATLAGPVQQAQARVQAMDAAARRLPGSAATSAATHEYPTPEAAIADLVATVTAAGVKVVAATSSAPAPGRYDVAITVPDGTGVASALTQLEQRSSIAALTLKAGQIQVTLRGTTRQGTDAH